MRQVFVRLKIMRRFDAAKAASVPFWQDTHFVTPVSLEQALEVDEVSEIR